MRFLFDEAATVEAIGYLLKKAGGTMNYTVALKILYLADREALARWGTPITGAQPYNLENGPVLSEVYDLIKGAELAGVWQRHIERSGYNIRLVGNVGDGELSHAVREVLAGLFEKYGHYSHGQMIDVCHRLPEWHQPDPVGSSVRLDATEILKAVGKGEREIAAIAEETEYYREARRKLG